MMDTRSCPETRQRRLGLPEVRESRGISLADIAGSTKISRRFLESIETERFEELPGGVYNLSYIRQYAAAIGYEESALVEEYQRSQGLSAASPAPPRRPAMRAFMDWFVAPAATER